MSTQADPSRPSPAMPVPAVDPPALPPVAAGEAANGGGGAGQREAIGGRGASPGGGLGASPSGIAFGRASAFEGTSAFDGPSAFAGSGAFGGPAAFGGAGAFGDPGPAAGRGWGSTEVGAEPAGRPLGVDTAKGPGTASERGFSRAPRGAGIAPNPRRTMVDDAGSASGGGTQTYAKAYGPSDPGSARGDGADGYGGAGAHGADAHTFGEGYGGADPHAGPAASTEAPGRDGYATTEGGYDRGTWGPGTGTAGGGWAHRAEGPRFGGSPGGSGGASGSVAYGPGEGGPAAHVGPTARGAAASPAPARLYLRANAEQWQGSPLLGLLVRLFRLDVYGTANLTRRATGAMEFGAVIMGLILVFDYSLWFIMLHMIFRGGELAPELSGEGIAAFLLAGMFAACFSGVSIIMESSVFTADLSRGWLRAVFAVGSRGLLVLAAAWITSRPFEVLLFTAPIAEHHQKELALEQAMRVATEVVQTRNRPPTATTASIEEEKVALQANQDATSSLAAAKAAQLATRRTQQERQRIYDGADRAYQRACGAADLTGDAAEACARRRSNRQFAATELQRAKDAARSADAAVVTAGEQAQAAHDARKQATADKGNSIDARAAEQQKSADALSAYAAQLQQKNAGEHAFSHPECADKYADPNAKTCAALLGASASAADSRCVKWCFESTPPNFFESLRIVEDLAAGTPPRWDTTRRLTPDECSEIVDNMKFQAPVANPAEGYLPPCTAAAGAGSPTVTSRSSASNIYAELKIVVWIVGMFVPLVSLLYKLAAPRELKDYYSLEWQAAAKHPEAMRQVEAEQRRLSAARTSA